MAGPKKTAAPRGSAVSHCGEQWIAPPHKGAGRRDRSSRQKFIFDRWTSSAGGGVWGCLASGRCRGLVMLRPDAQQRQLVALPAQDLEAEAVEQEVLADLGDAARLVDQQARPRWWPRRRADASRTGGSGRGW